MIKLTQGSDSMGDASMQAFFRQHGADALDSDPKKKDVRTPDSAGEQDADDEDSDLDVATLKALGLEDEDEGVESGPTSEKDDDDGTTPTPVDLEALAKHLGLDKDDLILSKDGLKVRAKVDGETFEVSPAELRKGYQLQSHFTKQTEQFKQHQQAWEQARQQQETILVQQAQLAQQVLDGEEITLNQEYSRYDWDGLRASDPGEYAARVAEYQNKLNHIRSRKHGLIQTVQQQAQQMQIQQQNALLEHRRQQAALLSENLKWDSTEKREKGGAALRSYLSKNVGLSDQEISAIGDYRTFLVVDKARKYDELMGKLEASRKKVSEHQEHARVPGGSGQAGMPQTQGRKRRVDAAMKKLETDHSVESAGKVFEHLGIV